MEIKSTKTRLSLYCAEHVKEYIESESEKLGMSSSAFMTMLAMSYKQQQESVSAMGKIEMLLDKVDKLTNSIT